MAHLSLVSGPPAARIDGIARRPGEDLPRPVRAAARAPDTAEISARAHEAARSGFRADLVRTVREQIEAGTYESAEKLDAAAARIVRDLNLTA